MLRKPVLHSCAWDTPCTAEQQPKYEEDLRRAQGIRNLHRRCLLAFPLERGGRQQQPLAGARGGCGVGRVGRAGRAAPGRSYSAPTATIIQPEYSAPCFAPPPAGRGRGGRKGRAGPGRGYGAQPASTELPAEYSPAPSFAQSPSGRGHGRGRDGGRGGRGRGREPGYGTPLVQPNHRQQRREQETWGEAEVPFADAGPPPHRTLSPPRFHVQELLPHMIAEQAATQPYTCSYGRHGHSPCSCGQPQQQAQQQPQQAARAGGLCPMCRLCDSAHMLMPCHPGHCAGGHARQGSHCSWTLPRMPEVGGYESFGAVGTCTDAVAMWVAEARYCPCATFSESTGHYTQVVWKGSTHVGCGWARCGTGVMVTCRYSPRGNVLGQFAGNV